MFVFGGLAKQQLKRGVLYRRQPTSEVAPVQRDRLAGCLKAVKHAWYAFVKARQSTDLFVTCTVEDVLCQKGTVKK